jgi:penicillin-binding protein 2
MVWQQEHRLIYEDFLERYRIVVFIFLGFFLFLSFRLFHLQVIRGIYYRTLSEQQRTQIILERAPRGTIFDRKGTILVGNKTAFVALFYPFTQGNKTPTKEILEQLRKILTVKDLGALVTKGWKTGQAVRLANDLSREEMFKLHS